MAVKGRSSAPQGHAPKSDPITGQRRVGPVYCRDVAEMLEKLSKPALGLAIGFIQKAAEVGHTEPDFITIDVRGMAIANQIASDAAMAALYEVSDYLLPTGKGGNWMALLTPVCVTHDEYGVTEVVVFAPPTRTYDTRTEAG